MRSALWLTLACAVGACIDPDPEHPATPRSPNAHDAANGHETGRDATALVEGSVETSDSGILRIPAGDASTTGAQDVAARDSAVAPTTLTWRTEPSFSSRYRPHRQQATVLASGLFALQDYAYGCGSDVYVEGDHLLLAHTEPGSGRITHWDEVQRGDAPGWSQSYYHHPFVAVGDWLFSSSMNPGRFSGGRRVHVDASGACTGWELFTGVGADSTGERAGPWSSGGATTLAGTPWVFIAGGFFYGGGPNHDGPLDTVFGAAFDAATGSVVGSWQLSGRLPAPRMDSSVAVTTDALYVSGGCEGVFTNEVDTVLRASLSPTGQLSSFTVAGHLPVAELEPLLVVRGNHAYYAGGRRFLRASVGADGTFGPWEDLSTIAPVPWPEGYTPTAAPFALSPSGVLYVVTVHELSPCDYQPTNPALVYSIVLP